MKRKQFVKNLLFGIATLCFSTIGYSQNTPWPATGNIGIGTTSPDALLQIQTPESFENGGNTMALHILNQTYGLYSYPTPATADIVNVSNILYSAISPGPPPLITPYFVIGFNGKVGIGLDPNDPSTTPLPLATPGVYNLYVTGGILTERVKVALHSYSSGTTTDWSDFVFNKDYKLMPLKKLEAYLNTNKHLPEVPSAQEVEKQGIDVAEMDSKLLQKIEELTLYMIQVQKNVEQLEKENKELKKQVKLLKK